MDKGKDGNYGSHIIKDVSQTCYARPIITNREQECAQHQLKNEIDRVVGEYLSKEVKDEIFNAFQSHMIDADSEIYSRAQFLLIDLLKIIASGETSRIPSQTTLVLSEDSTKQEDGGSKQKKRRCDVDNKKDNMPQTNDQFDSIPQIKPDDPCQFGQAEVTKNVFTGQGEKVEDTTTRLRSFSLNHTVSADDGVSCASFNNRQLKSSLSQQEASKRNVEEGKIQECFSKTVPYVAQDYIDIDSKVTGHISKEEYLKEASKKYYFRDPSAPSFRFFEYEDDNGKYIEEPELWRPLPGSTMQNVEQVDGHLEVNKLNEVHQNDNCNILHVGSNFQVNNLNEKPQENNSFVDGYYSPPRQEKITSQYCAPNQTTPAYKSNDDNEFEFSTIQCAQRQKSYYSPLEQQHEVMQDNNEKEIIDLDPTTQPSQPTQLTPSTKANTKMILKGRRLFDDGSTYEEDQKHDWSRSTDQKLKQHVR